MVARQHEEEKAVRLRGAAETEDQVGFSVSLREALTPFIAMQLRSVRAELEQVRSQDHQALKHVQDLLENSHAKVRIFCPYVLEFAFWHRNV